MMETQTIAVDDHPRTAAARDFRDAVADPEVMEKARRRRFSASYKLKLLEEVERNPGQVGAILRREGLYSSHLWAWRKQRQDGSLKALGGKRGPRGKSVDAVEVEKLRRQVVKLERELGKAKLLIEVQKKLAMLLGEELPKIAAEHGSDEKP